MAPVQVHCAFLLAMTSSPAIADVLIVGGAQQTHSTVPIAIAAAVDGDVILVRDPFVPYFIIDGKGVSVIADMPTPVSFGQIHVLNLSANQTVVISGFKYQTGSSSPMSLELSSNAGSVRIQDFEAHADELSFAAVEVSGSADVSFSRSKLFGADGQFTIVGISHSTPALQCWNSSVTLYDCTLKGGRGCNGGYSIYSSTPSDARPGNAAVLATNSTLFFSGCSLVGGDGGIGYSGGAPPPQCTTPSHFPTNGGDGAVALNLNDVSSLSRTRATSLQGGAGGPGGFDPCNNQAPSGTAAGGYSGPPAGLVPVGGSARSLLAPTLVRESGPANLSFFGEPGDRVYLLTSAGCTTKWAPTLGATLLVKSPFRRSILGIVPVGGRLDVVLPVTAPPPGVNEMQKHLQCVMLDAAGTSHGGTATTLTVLDQQF